MSGGIWATLGKVLPGSRSNPSYQPVGRGSHKTAIVKEDLILWGGELGSGVPKVHDSPEKREFLSRVEILHLARGEWECRTSRGTPPLAVSSYACSAINNDIFYFGGYCGHTDCFHNSIHKLGIPSLHWTEIAPTASEGDGPMKKSACGMVSFKELDEDILFVVGGWGSAASTAARQKGACYETKSNLPATNEQHMFSLSTGEWSSPSVTGQVPPPCAMFSLTYIDNCRAVMFGCRDSQLTCDLWLVDLTKHHVHWSRIRKPNGHPVEWPDERAGHTACCIDASVLAILGGWRGVSNVMADCWLFGFATQEWTKLVIPESITERMAHSMSVFRLSTHCVWLIVFGGTTYSKIGPISVVANTVIIELVQSEDGTWHSGRVIEQDVLSNSKEYQRILAEAIGRMAPSSPLEISTNLMRRTYSVAGTSSVPSSPLEISTNLMRRTSSIAETSSSNADEEDRQIPKSKKLAEQQQKTTEEAFQQFKTSAELQINQLNIKMAELEHENKCLREQLDQQVAMALEALQATNRRAQESLEELERLRKQLAPAEIKEEQPHWIVEKKEVILSNELVGKGAWGEVKVAKFRGLKVAAKCIHESINSPYYQQQFKREMDIAAKLRHPNLLLFIGATQGNKPLILTELMSTSLRKELEKGAVTRPHVVTISQDVSCGLMYLHEWKPQPIIHRDISSANVLLELLSNGWRAKVSDYGSANFMNAARTVGPGAAVYAAPEACSADAQSPAMDVFSFGVLLIEMCLQKLPVGGKEQRTAEIKLINWPAMVTIIGKCTHENKFARPCMSGVKVMIDRL